MPILRNPRHERFAQELAAGKSAAEAYGLAGYKPSRSHSSELERQRSISERVADILAQRERIEATSVERAIERTAVTKERVIAELAKLGFANMMDYMRVGEDGDPVLDFSAITRDQAAALVEVTVDEFKDGRGRRIKFKLADKRGPLVDLGKELGMFIERKEIRTGTLDNLNATERDHVRDAIRRELEGRPGGNQSAGPAEQAGAVSAVH